MEQIQKLADGETFKNLKSKCVGFTSSQISLAEVMAKRMAKLGNVVMKLESDALAAVNVENLTYREIVALYSMFSIGLTNASDYVQKTTNTTDWADLEAQLTTLTENRSEKVNSEVSRGAESLLKRLIELKPEDTKRVDSSENIIATALNLADPKDVAE